MQIYIARLRAMTSLLVDIPDEALDRQFTEVELTVVAKHLLDWQEKAGGFGLSEGEVEDIREDNKYSNRSQKLTMLRRWKERSGEKANLRKLVMLAERNGWRDFIRAVCIELGHVDEDGKIVQ